MSNKLGRALARLNTILPLAEHYQALAPGAVQVHNVILNSYASTGRAPLVNALSEDFIQVANILHDLQQADLVVLDDAGAIRGAYPFTSEARIHQAVLGETRAYSMCALDVLAIGPMFRQATQIYSQCMLSAKPVFIVQSGQSVVNARECADLFLAIDWSAACSLAPCADGLCGQMNFISGAARANAWQTQTDQREIFNLAEAIEFATAFFIPLTPKLQVA